MRNKFRHLAAHAKNKGLTNFVTVKIYDNYIKMQLRRAGVNFSQTTAQEAKSTAVSLNNDAHENQSSSYYDLKKSFAFLPFGTSQINRLDIGCGSGRVLNYCILRNTKSVTGIDLDEEALQLAEQNCAALKNKGYVTPYSVRKADATVFPIPAAVNTVYMFNPFGSQTMQATLYNILSHVKATNRPLYLIYCMPTYKTIFEVNSNCRKIYEEYNRANTQCELCIFEITT